MSAQALRCFPTEVYPDFVHTSFLRLLRGLVEAVELAVRLAEDRLCLLADPLLSSLEEEEVDGVLIHSHARARHVEENGRNGKRFEEPRRHLFREREFRQGVGRKNNR